MKQIQNTQGFSLVLALGLTLLLSFTALYVLEYMVPFSRNITGIEHATSAYYQSSSGIESALFERASNDIGYQNTEAFVGGPQDFRYDIIANGTQIPRQNVDEGSSRDSIASDLGNWNILSLQEPIQLLVGLGRFPTTAPSLTLRIQVPDFDKNTLRDSLNTVSDDDIAFWQLSSTTDSISSTGSSFMSESSVNSGFTRNLMTSSQIGVLKNGSTSNFLSFYNSQCRGTQECVFKVSLIRELISSLDDARLPNLEYRITSSVSIPLQSSLLSSQGKSYGFSKSLEVQVPQLTTNAAFDFTLFQ